MSFSMNSMRSAGMPGPGRACTAARASTRPHVAHTTSWLIPEQHTVWL
jgi:hypothetical protein